VQERRTVLRGRGRNPPWLWTGQVLLQSPTLAAELDWDGERHKQREFHDGNPVVCKDRGHKSCLALPASCRAVWAA
jgi:hypothetical protein